MIEVQGIDCQRVTILSQIRLNAQLQGTPLTVEHIPAWSAGVVQSLPVVVQHIGPGVGETPSDVPVEPDHNSRNSRDSCSVHVHFTGHGDVHFVPDRRQSEAQVRIARQESMASRASGWRHRPVVAAYLPDPPLSGRGGRPRSNRLVG